MKNWYLTGDWGWLPGLALGVALAAAAWFLYRPALRSCRPLARTALPLLRSLAILLVVMMLTGPAIRHRVRLGGLAQLDVVLDASESMDLSDPAMSPERKLLIADRLGWLRASAIIDLTPARVSEQLAAARAAIPAATRPGGAPVGEAANALREAIQGIPAALGAAEPGSLAGITRKGHILYERWDGIPNDEIAGLTGSPAFTEKPDHAELLDTFAVAANQGDNFGDRLRGYLYPPATGDYTFWIAGDDESELWLSSDARPGNKQRIARVPDYTAKNEWTRAPEQQSRPISLVQGRRYYVEVLHKEGGGEDHVAVGWRLPDGALQRPIPGAVLAPATPGNDDPDPENVAARFERELLEPAARLAAEAGDLPPGDGGARLQDLARDLAFWEEDLRRCFADLAGEVADRDDPGLRAILDRFDHVSRSQRVASLLLEGADPLLARLAREHDVAVYATQDDGLAPLWSSRVGSNDVLRDLPERLALRQLVSRSDLGLALGPAFLASESAGATQTVRRAVLLLSDGRHTSGPSPLQQTRVLGARGIPVFTVGLGSEHSPPDLAVTGVEAPPSVFHKDTLNGRVFLQDDLPAGLPFTLTARCLNQVVWEKTLTTRGASRYAIPFEVPLEELVAKTGALEPGLERAGVVLELSFALDPPALDQEAGNNQFVQPVFAALRRHRVLYIEDRPRWEWRYLRNLFERDRQWEINPVLLQGGNLPRGDRSGAFPETREQLFAYDLVMIGDVPVGCWEAGELDWLAGFVGERGGGVILLDGPRRHLAGYHDTPLAALFPVTGLDQEERAGLGGWSLTRVGAALPAFDLSRPGNGANDLAWAELPAARRLTRVTPLPGSEVLLEEAAGATNLPAVVYRRFGGGRVLYQAFDETWRWRYNVEDLYHRRYWSQVALWLMEAPYAVRNEAGSLDAGALQYLPGQRAALRARLLDEQGNLVTDAHPFAVIERDGRPFARVPLAGDQDGGGALRSLSPPLEAGEYTVTLAGNDLPDAAYALRADISVRAPVSRERMNLSAEMQLLKEMSRVSGGAFVTEEQIDRVVDGLRPLSEGKVIETETLLWQSYWWFALVVLLLTMEWLIRKREGLS